MLGMMNCPTSENFDFYASSPTAVRQVASGENLAAKLEGTSGDFGADDEEGNGTIGRKRTASNPLEVFSGLSQRPKFSYTEDGRRLIDGKLENGSDGPEQLWGRVIVDSVTANKLCRQRSSSHQRQLMVEMGTDGQKDAADTDGQKEQKQKRRFSFGSIFPALKKSNGGNVSNKVEQKKGKSTK